MEKDPDEATVISSGSGRDQAGKEHLVLGGPGISSGMLMAMRRLDAAEAVAPRKEPDSYRLLAGDRDREQLRD